MKRFIYFSLIVLFMGLSANAQTTGREIIQAVKDRPNGDTRQSDMTMKLINKRGSVRERKLRSYSIDVGKNHNDTKTIMFFLYPGDTKGTGFLTWDYDDINKEDDKWLYLPALKKTRRISGSSAKKDYFMGSDFTYDDMGRRNIDEDTHQLLGEEKIDGHLCWKIESTSKEGRDAYAKKISLIRKDILVPLKIEYFDKMNKLQRVLIFSDIEKIEGFWTIKKMHMTNVQTEHQTILEFYNSKYNVPLKEDAFSTTALEKGDI